MISRLKYMHCRVYNTSGDGDSSKSCGDTMRDKTHAGADSVDNTEGQQIRSLSGRTPKQGQLVCAVLACSRSKV